MKVGRISWREKMVRWDYLPAWLLIAGVLVHTFYLRPVLGMSKWFGGGFGIYCETNKRNLVTWVEVDGEFRKVESQLFDKAGLYSGKFQWIPYYTPELLESYLEAIKELYGAGRVIAQIWEYQYTDDIASGRLVLIESVEK